MNFKGIQQKSIACFTTTILILFSLTAAIIFWRLDQNLHTQSEAIGKEILIDSKKQMNGHLSVVFTLLDDLKQSVFKFSDALSKNNNITANIENQQLEALKIFLTSEAQSSNIDFALVLDKDGVFQAAYPEVAEPKTLAQAIRSLPIYNDVKSSEDSKKTKGFYKIDSKVLNNFNFADREIISTDSLTILSANLILDDFEDEFGIIIAGKILNGYNKIFEQVFIATGSSGALFINDKSVSSFGITEKNTPSLQLAQDIKNNIYSGNKYKNLDINLANKKFIMSCTPITSINGSNDAAICVGQDEQMLLSLKNTIIASGEKSFRNIQAWLLGTGLTTIVLFILVIILVTHSINSPLAKISSTLSIQGKGIGTEAKQISATSLELSVGASSQASAVEETSASMEELYSMTRSNAQTAIELESLMNKVKDIVSKTNEDMLGVNSAIEDISKASDETYNIIKSIDDIAFQTNLLALNAAVEAARAGDSGAGFAVVADEVRNLAQRAASAASETSNLIQGTVKKVNDGKILVSATTSSFTEVFDNVVKVGALINDIASASQQQTDGFNQVNKSISEIEAITSNNSAASEETASVAEDFAHRAEMLNRMVQELEILVYGQITDHELEE